MRASFLSVFLLSLFACDPGEIVQATPPPRPAVASAEATAPAKEEPAKVEASKLEETKTDVTGDRSGLAACLTACDEGKMSRTDRATCRMNCDTAHNVPGTLAAADADGGVGKASACMSKCLAGSPDSKACVQSCKADVAGGVNAPSAATLDQLGTCLGECHADRTLKPTDRETCKLTCEQTATTAGPGKTGT